MALKARWLHSLPWAVSMSCKSMPPLTRTLADQGWPKPSQTEKQGKIRIKARGSKALPSGMKDRAFNFNHQGLKKKKNQNWPTAMTLLFSQSYSAESQTPSHPSVHTPRRVKCTWAPFPHNLGGTPHYTIVRMGVSDQLNTEPVAVLPPHRQTQAKRPKARAISPMLSLGQ